VIFDWKFDPLFVRAISFADRALGDKSELPSLVAAPSPTISTVDNTSALCTDTRECGIESGLSDLSVSTAGSCEDGGQASVGSHDVVNTDAESENVSSTVDHSESIADTDVADELDTEDAAAASDRHCEAGTDLTPNNTDVDSASKGDINCVIM